MSDALAQFHVLRPWWLVLLVPAFVLWWRQRQAGDATRAWARVMDPGLIAVLTVGRDQRARIQPADALLAVWIVTIVAIAGPTWRREPSPLAAPAPPAMVVLKVSPSMLTPDLAPTRLDRARQKIADLLTEREGAATGLIAYCGSAHLVLPPTQDSAVLNAMALALTPQVMPTDGDALEKAVALARRVLGDAGQGGSVLVVADTIAPDQIASLSADKSGPPTTILAAAPAGAVQADPALSEASRALGARLVQTTVDGSDVTALAGDLRSGPRTAAADQAARWLEAGYWLTPLIALATLGWFRRGWVLDR